MTIGQVTLILVSIAIAGVTYLFAPLLPPEQENREHSAIASVTVDFDYEAYKQEELKRLIPEDSARYQQLISELNSTGDKPGKLNEITSLLESNQLRILVALTVKDALNDTDVDSSWYSLGKILYTNAFTTDNQQLAQYVLSQAIACYEKALEINSENTDAKINLATAYLEGQSAPMKGVMLLREITDKDPDNITANLILGKYGIVSGQFDKAAKRLQKVLSIDSLNVEAYLYLAEAYEGMGDKTKAIEALEQCKKVVTDSGFSNEISNYIEKLKNS